MVGMNMSKELKKNWLVNLQERYAGCQREGRSRMLDELCEDYEYKGSMPLNCWVEICPRARGEHRQGRNAVYQGIEPVVRQIRLSAEQARGKRLVPILRQWLAGGRYVAQLCRNLARIRSSTGTPPNQNYGPPNWYFQWPYQAKVTKTVEQNSENDGAHGVGFKNCLSRDSGMKIYRMVNFEGTRNA